YRTRRIPRDLTEARTRHKPRRNSSRSISQSLKMKRKFFSERVLIAFKRVDFSDAEIERIGESDDLRPSLRKELELRVSNTRRTQHKFGVEIVSSDKPQTAICIRSVRHQPVSAIIACVA